MNDGLDRQNMDIRLLLAGGKSSFMDYFTAGHPHAAVCASLKKHPVCASQPGFRRFFRRNGFDSLPECHDLL
jgi:hypothetical protein